MAVNSPMREPAAKVINHILDYGYVTAAEITEITGIAKVHNILHYLTEHYTLYEDQGSDGKMMYGLLSDSEVYGILRGKDDEEREHN